MLRVVTVGSSNDQIYVVTVESNGDRKYTYFKIDQSGEALMLVKKYESEGYVRI